MEMLVNYKDRAIEESIGERVEVYRNLHNKKFSIKRGGYVQGHGTEFIVRNGVPKYSKAGQRRAKETQVRNVHASLVGELERVSESNQLSDIELTGKVEITYDPFGKNYFHEKETGKEKTEPTDYYFKGTKVYELS